MYGCTRELEDSVTTTQHRTNSPGALKIKAGVKTREHDSRREHRMSREPPGYFFGMRALFPECSCGWPSLERRAVHFDFSYGAPSTGMSWNFCFWGQDCILYEATTGASRTRRRNHPMSRPPIESTGLELELTKRTDREEHHLLRLAFRWWSLFGSVVCFYNSSNILK